MHMTHTASKPVRRRSVCVAAVASEILDKTQLTQRWQKKHERSSGAA